MKVLIKPSTSKGKKYMAIFMDGDKKVKTTHFGASAMSDFTKNKDPARKASYLARHRTTENWADYKSAGSLSRYILWNKPTLRGSIADYKRRFSLN
tara:strand:- start:2106 stop:2393 length:288 start_codon:yes stop_codon:yes gene_type:complete